MVRIVKLLALARRSESRVLRTKLAPTERALALLFVLICGTALLYQLSIVAFAEVSKKQYAAKHVLLTLTTAWLLLPLIFFYSMPSSSLSIYPLTRLELSVFRCLSCLQSRPMLSLLGASALLILAALELPHPILHVTEISAAMGASALIGIILASLMAMVQRFRFVMRGSRSSSISRRSPLLHKEIRYLVRTLDPYLGLLIACGISFTEFYGSWMTPTRIMMPYLLLCILQLPLVLNPFALGSDGERDRYRLLPVECWKVLLQKHAAIVLVFFLTSSPILATLLVKVKIEEFVAAVLQVGVVVAIWMCAGLALVPIKSNRNIRIDFGTLSGTGMSMGMLFAASITMTAPSVVAMMLSRRTQGGMHLLACSALLVSFVGVYRMLLTKVGSANDMDHRLLNPDR